MTAYTPLAFHATMRELQTKTTAKQVNKGEKTAANGLSQTGADRESHPKIRRDKTYS